MQKNPGLVNRTPMVRRISGLRLGSVIELNRTHPKILPIEHLEQSNIIENKTSFIWFQTRRQISYVFASVSNTSKAKMSQREQRSQPPIFWLRTTLLKKVTFFILTLRKNILLFALLLFLLHLMNHCNAKSVACIASIVHEQLSQW